MLSVVSKDLWAVIEAKNKKAATRRAAIAYVGNSPPITFKNGDVLVVDASDESIKTGRTSAKTLSAFHKAGVELWSHAKLHAKVMLLDDWSVIGSANASQRSKKTYTEAAIITNRPDVASQIEQFIHALAQHGVSTSIGQVFLRRISKIKVTKEFFDTRSGETKSKSPVIRSPRTWLLGLIEDAEYPGSKKLVEAIAREERKKVNSSAGKIDWFWYSGGQGFPVKAKDGDLVIGCWRPKEKIKSSRSVQVYQHTRLIRIFSEPGQKAKTFHYLVPPDSKRRALTWSEFAKLARRAGITRKLSYRSSVQLNEQQSNALFELWPK